MKAEKGSMKLAKKGLKLQLKANSKREVINWPWNRDKL